jgi:soluble lytic murein transglycosylase-like protein
MASTSAKLFKISISLLAVLGAVGLYAAWNYFSDIFVTAYRPCIYSDESHEKSGKYEIHSPFSENPDVQETEASKTKADTGHVAIGRKAATAWVSELRKNNPYLDDFKAAADAYNVPVLLLLAICDQESGYKPWALNIAGKSFFPESRESALTVLKENYQPSYDVGLMQINSYWIRRLKLRVHDVFEPKINIHIAAYILDECFRSYGLGWKALGAYHHPPDRDSARSMRYARAVWSRYVRYEKWAAKFFQK